MYEHPLFAGLTKIKVKSEESREAGWKLMVREKTHAEHDRIVALFNTFTGFVRPGGFECESHRAVRITGGSLLGSRSLACQKKYKGHGLRVSMSLGFDGFVLVIQIFFIFGCPGLVAQRG